MLHLILLTLPALAPAPKIDGPKQDEATMKKAYEKLTASLHAQNVVGRHPEVANALKGQEPKAVIEALQVLARTADPNALPLMVPYLESQDPTVRIWAGATVSQLVEGYALRRRDPQIGDRVVLKPLGKDDLDLRPLAWLVVRMLNGPDDGNTHAYAAVMIRYLELREFAPQLRPLLGSRHPAVSDKAKWALDELAGGQEPAKNR